MVIVKGTLSGHVTTGSEDTAILLQDIKKESDVATLRRRYNYLLSPKILLYY